MYNNTIAVGKSQQIIDFALDYSKISANITYNGNIWDIEMVKEWCIDQHFQFLFNQEIKMLMFLGVAFICISLFKTIVSHQELIYKYTNFNDKQIKLTCDLLLDGSMIAVLIYIVYYLVLSPYAPAKHLKNVLYVLVGISATIMIVNAIYNIYKSKK